MLKTWVVIKREFLSRVRTKWFLISTILGPVLMAAMILMPIMMATRGGRERSIAVIDVTSTGFGERVAEMVSGPGTIAAVHVEAEAIELESVADSLAGAVGRQQLDGFLIVTDETVQDGRTEYRGANVSAQLDMEILRRRMRQAVLTERLDRVGVDPALVAQANIPVDMRTVNIRDGEITDESGEAMFFLAYLMWFLLYMAILLYGVQVMGAVVEEKTTRVVEVLVSSLKPFQLLAGKVIGVGAVGLFQLAIWGVTARLLLTRREIVTRMFGIDEAVAQGLSLPEIPVGTIAVMLVYFLLGYFLYAAMFAAVAATSSSEAEARQAQAPVTFLLVIPAILSVVSMVNEPDGALFTMLTMIPLSSPIAMPARWVVSNVPLAELIASIAFLILALLGVTWLAGRIYRVGILMYGKRPGVGDLVRWVRSG
jgi:ABC-2 type transport system permease protein